MPRWKAGMKQSSAIGQPKHNEDSRYDINESFGDFRDSWDLFNGPKKGSNNKQNHDGLNQKLDHDVFPSVCLGAIGGHGCLMRL